MYSSGEKNISFILLRILNERLSLPLTYNAEYQSSC